MPLIVRRLVGLAATLFLVLFPAQSIKAHTTSATSTANTKLCIHAKPRSGQNEITAVTDLEKKIGRGFAMNKHYYKWGTAFRATSAAQIADDQAGRIPIVHWKAKRSNGQDVKWSSIASGAEDSVVRSMASSIKGYGRTLFLDFHHEPENDTGSTSRHGNNGTAADYVAAFRHIHAVFKSMGVTNVKWLQTLMVMTIKQGKQGAWYVGPQYVDYLGFNGFNWSPAKGKWRTLTDIFAIAYKWTVSMGKPMIIPETGVQEDTPARKADWFLDALNTIKSWPNLKVFCYFHSPSIYPWWIDSTVSSLTAYKTLANDPWMKA